MNAVLCYFIAAMTSIAAGVALMLARHGSAVSRRGAIACAFSAVWALWLMVESRQAIPVTSTTLIFEVLRGASWLVVLLALRRAPFSTAMGLCVLGIAGQAVFDLCLHLFVD